MEIFYTILVLIIFIALLSLLFYMQKKQHSFSKRVLVGLGLGLVFGALVQLIFKGPWPSVIKIATDWMSIVGSGYVALLRMITIPLIMISILTAILNLETAKGVLKMSLIVIGILVATAFISALIGAGTSVAFGLNAEQIQMSEREEQRGESLEAQNVDKGTVPQQILKLLPSNPFASMAGQGDSPTIAVVIFTALLGISALGIKNSQRSLYDKFREGIAVIHSVVFKLVDMILELTPYGILAIMTKTIATTDFNAILTLIKFIIASYIALILVLVIHAVILIIFKFKPQIFFKKSWPALSFAFTSRTSVGTLPLTIDALKNKLGLSEGISNFAATFGTSIGQNGCAGVYPAMLAVMIVAAQGGNPLNPMFLISVAVISALSSFGIAGVGGGATMASIMVLSALGLPVALAGVLISVEPLIDMGRTAVNVSGSMVSGLVAGRLTKQIDDKIYNNNDVALNSTE